MSDDSKFFRAFHKALVRHLAEHALRTDGPFTLRSGAEADWYLDARQTTFSGDGATLVARAILEIVSPHATAIGGMTMGADPIAIATSVVASLDDKPLKAFSIRKAPKDHGTGGRLVGPVGIGDRAVIVEDTTSTGGAFFEAIEVAKSEGIGVVQAIAVVDRSGDLVASQMEQQGVPYRALVTPADLGVD